MGMDVANQDHIFQIFRRLPNAKNIAGTGMGLAICKKIAELNGGKIWFDSVLLEGSRFYVELT